MTFNFKLSIYIYPSFECMQCVKKGNHWSAFIGTLKKVLVDWRNVQILNIDHDEHGKMSAITINMIMNIDTL